MTGNNEKYDLYTEKIKGSPFTKYRRLINFMKVLMAAALTGLVAGLCFVLVVNLSASKMEEASETRKEVNIPLDELPGQTTSIISEDIVGNTQQQLPPINNVTMDNTTQTASVDNIDYGIYEYMSNISKEIAKSIVTITVIEENEDPVLSIIQNKTNTPGIIIADNDVEYLILTDYSVNEADMLRVRFVDDESMTGTFIMGDKTADIAIIAVAHSDMPDGTREAISIAQMGNSYMLEAGELVIAMGDMYGVESAVDFGTTISTTKAYYEVDSKHGMIYTNINAGSGCNGFLFTDTGELVGTISNEKTATNIVAYGISDIKLRIQNLSNRKQIGYIGITGQEITEELKDNYEIPNGVYVTAIEEYSPAYYAGIANGDIITDISGKLITNVYNIERTMCEFEPGTEVKITVYRRGRGEYVPIEYTVTLGER